MSNDIQRTGNVGAMSSWIVSKKALVERYRASKRSPNIKRGGGTAIERCQENVDAEIDGGPAWLQLSQVLQNLTGKGIATMLGRVSSLRVVIKVQEASAARREMKVQEQLRGLDGFVRFHCMFHCAGDKQYIESYGTAAELRRNRVCTAKGLDMGVILMPYYEGGSLEDMLRTKKQSGQPWRADETTLVKSVLSKVIGDVYRAYEKKRFVHGDLFCKNIVLTAQGDPALIDFELSEFEASGMRFWRNIDSLLSDVGNYWKQRELDDIARTLFVHMAYDVPPTQSTVDDLLGALAART
jgi:serine/threonine protein kinase